MSDHITIEHIPGMTPEQEARRRAEIAGMSPEEFQALADHVARDGPRGPHHPRQ